MSSPFPGMDPYLEQHWGDIHTRMMVYMGDQINEQLPPDLLARVEENVTVDVEEASRLIYLDVRVLEQPGFESNGQSTPSGVAVAEPCVIAIPDELPTERHIEIVETGSGHRVVTAIELLSPANKTNRAGRRAYRAKQRQYIQGGVNLVEIDLIRQGAFVAAIPRKKLPRKVSRPYLICVRWAHKRDEAELIGVTMREALPNVAIPLRPSDADVVLQLQPLLDECYRRGRYATIDYSRPLRPALGDEDRRWVEELLAPRKRGG